MNPEYYLPKDVFQSIFQYLPLKALANTKFVSSSWKKAAESVKSNAHKAPWLTLPSEDEEKLNGRFPNASCRFKNIEENIIYTVNKTSSDMLLKFPCIGSSQGWLILIDVSTLSPLLLNLFKEDPPIELPTIKSLFNISMIQPTNQNGLFIVQRGYSQENLYNEFVRASTHLKAILTVEPEPRGDYDVVLLYKGPICGDSKIGFFKNGNESWIEVSNFFYHHYQDIICFENKLYALSTNQDIHIWDLQNFSPEKRMVIYPSFVKQRDIPIGGSRYFRRYLVESEGEIMLVDRLVSEQGFHYATTLFTVYKLVAIEKTYRWVEVDSLGDRALFLGGNHSVSVSTKGLRTCKRNSIYFTDDFWDMTIYDWNKYGHDNGRFSLEDGSCLPIFEFGSQNVQPLPCWIVPN